MAAIKRDYPWTTWPLISGGPMRLIALASLAVEISAAGGIGFIGAGSDLDFLDDEFVRAAELIKSYTQLEEYRERSGILPVGFGVLNWGANLETASKVVAKWKPAAIWLFGAYENKDYATWAEKIREASEGKTKIWIQVGTVADAVDISQQSKPDVLVVQGSDAGGHGLAAAAGIITLFPEVDDALQTANIGGITLFAAGGILDGRALAAMLALGASGVAMGTRFLASEEATIAKGYQDDVIRVTDGGLTTARTKVYDQLRGTTLWPERYNGRGILNQSFTDHNAGLSVDENKKLYDEALKKGDGGWGIQGRLTAYAGTGVGLVHEVLKAGDIVREVQQAAKERLQATTVKFDR